MDEKKNSFHLKIKQSEKNKKNAINISKILSKEEAEIHDIVEQKSILLKNIKENTKNIKKTTIKEFVYTNKNIPKAWKNKRNYQKIVLELFAEDDKFLKYLKNEEEKDNTPNNDEIKIRPKTATSGRNKMKKQSNVNKRNRNNKLSLGISGSMKSDNINNTTYLSSMSSFDKNKPSKIKLKKIITPQEEIQVIFDNLNQKYPLRNKLEELYPKYTQIKKEKDNKDKELNNLKSYDEMRFHKINKIQRNLFSNILTLNKNNNKIKRISFTKEKNDDNDNKKLVLRDKKEIIKNQLNDSTIFNHLKSMNFYGPYFSYCSNCSNNNIKYYKYMERNQCINLLNYIKNERNKKLEIQESKFREKNKNKKDFYNK
jgi:hypothetical protein